MDDKKACVISGGGSFGAYMVGLISARKVNYDLVAGTSTGATMAPFVALQAYDRLYQYYTSVTNPNIYNVDPFLKNGRFNLLKALIRVIRKKRTFGETENLRELLKSEFLHSDFLHLRELKKEVIVSATNISIRPYKTDYFSNLQTSYDDFIDFMWASTLVTGISSILVKNDAGGRPNEYSDGGVRESTSIEHVAKLGYKHIDVYVHKVVPRKMRKKPVQDIFHNLIRHYHVIRDDNQDDLERAVQMVEDGKIEELNMYFLPGEFENYQATRFYPTQMEVWYHLGLSNASNENLIKKYTHGNNQLQR